MAKSKKIELPPEPGLRHFVVHSCYVEQSGKTLTLTIPPKGLTWRGAVVDKKGHAAWTKPQPLDASKIEIACNGRTQVRRDGADYPKAARADGTAIVFAGSASFGRVLHGETSRFLVQANVKKISGLPKGTSWDGFESIELTGEPIKPLEAPAPRKGKKAIELADGGGGGPHQPYP